jgi:RND family efflux transporter MFP subunit
MSPEQQSPAAPQSPPTHRQAQHAPEENAIPQNLPRPGAWTVIAVALALIVLLVAMFFIGYFPHHKQEQQAKSDAASQAEDIPVVTVAAPRVSSPTTELFLPCDVRAFQETAIFPRTNGYLKKLYVDIQSPVTVGQLIAEIDSPEVDAQLLQAQGALAQANAAVVKAKAQLDLARRTLDRYHDLQTAREFVVTRQEVEQKESDFTAAIGEEAQASANVVAADATVKRFTILQGFEKVTAPFDGIITARQYDVGALLSATDSSPGTEMFRIAQVDRLRVFVNVPQVYVNEIKINAPAHLEVRNHPGVDFLGIVARNSGALDQRTRTMPFELHFPNKDNQLFAGMYGTAKLQLSQEHPVLLVPTAALRFDADGVQVATVKDQKIHLQKVQPGRDLGTELEIVSGLNPDDQVVTNPAERITEGSSVRVIDLSQKDSHAAPAPRASAQ